MAGRGGTNDSLTQRARSILFTSREADFMQSFIRAGDGAGDDGGTTSAGGVASVGDRRRPSISLALPLKLPQGAPQDTPTSRRTLPTGEERRSSQGSVPAPAAPPVRKNTPFAQMTKDIKLRRIHQQQQELQMLLRQGRRSGKGDSYFRRGEECYTDKDRAAAVNMGNRDIKLSLKLKRRQERSKALQIPEQADPNTLLTLGGHEMKGGDLKVALGFVNKALELQPHDKHALVARSKCHLLLGLAEEALHDANAALALDKHFVKGIFQKAEALYHLGDFEHSLMFYHRGQRLRPEQAGFRLGVQKAQEAIENAICSCRDKLALLSAKYADGFSLENNNCAIANNANEVDDIESATNKENNLKPASPLSNYPSLF
ncbi:Hypothetical predicted protein [Cloeon dipterum]|uniref:Outer dynein arm-docking complex subunit 4 n=1 Tax=Cloeon dipterum TaxID=197152 RepID=A0A8S1CJY0_9INSE|nr:Hypothetical predicted protein [Cloeon dipterum]